jgi:succinyl-CoA synthetase beta subunit
MDLLEYQAKELFRMVDIPILPSQTIKDSRKIKQLQIPYPVVLKSQVRSGGRGKVGGVKFVANTIDAIAAARTIFNLSILGEYPEVILAEAHYNAEREFFLAIVLDYDLQCPVLLGSAYGGMNVNSLLANLQQVVVTESFSLFYARRLAANMGLSGQLICSVSEIIAKMYRLFQEQDLDLIEINPLGVNAKGELMALDGKITVNDHALSRQPIIKALNLSKYQQQDNLEQTGWYWLDWQNQSGKIATICNSFDLALLTWDLLSQNKVNPACGIVIEDNFAEAENSSSLYQDRLRQILTELTSIKGLKAILINIWSTETISNEIIETIAEYIQSRSQLNSADQTKTNHNNNSRASGKDKLLNSTEEEISQPTPKFILRLLQVENSLNLKSHEGIYLFSSLEDSISEAIAVVKSS